MHQERNTDSHGTYGRDEATVGKADQSLKLYEGHVHDLLNDLDKERVLADIQQWFDTHIPAARAVCPASQAAPGGEPLSLP